MGIVVTKFGGSSLSEASQFRKVKEILLGDSNRMYVVPSAPGRREPDDAKVTDMLYTCHKLASKGELAEFEKVFAELSARYTEIIDELGLNLDFAPHLEQVHYAMLNGQSVDYAASRGEYLNGIILAEYLGWEFIDAAEVIFFDANHRFDSERTQEVLSARLAGTRYAVIPGFYGSNPDGTIRTFSRGGSDVTGAIVARAAGAELYENWTDVSGFLMADPRIVKRPKRIHVITYRELRELSYMGAGVLHEDAIFPVRMAGIPINIRNTNEPDNPGTMIVRADESHVRGAITGIAGKKGFTAIAVEKNMMNSELGFGRRLLEALEECNVSFEHMPSGIDTLSLVIDERGIPDLEKLLADLTHVCHPDSIEIVRGIALIAVVGQGMAGHKGTAAQLFGSLADADVNIRMIDQGSSEMNIILAVEEADFEPAVRAAYAAFEK